MATRPDNRLWPTVCGLVVLAAGLSACATTVDGSAGAPSAEVSSYRSEMSVSRAAAARTDSAVALCRQTMTSTGVMVRDYNGFVNRLNDTDDYAAVGGLAGTARTSLTTGADQIRATLTEATPPDVGGPANAFLGSTGRLADAIAQKRLVGLNPVAEQWNRDKQALLTSCGVYLPPPPPPSTAPPPAPSPTG
ncbi:hypothetical protein AAFP30_03125 [Gordonia sp. CPCC 205515]|uniref:hypothetical protein n=1 Tax=Gordonia sp. CPCC 205515 TaxID=3140791 RepID=UPI003AF3811C